MPRTDGIDVSRYQGRIDWTLVPAFITWVAVKATQGTGWLDPYFKANRAAISNRKYRLLYHFLDPVGPIARLTSWGRQRDGRLQAAWFLNNVGPLADGEGVMLDVEGANVYPDQAQAFCETVEAFYKRPVAVYTGRYVAGGAIWNSTSLFNGQRARVLAAYLTEDVARARALPYRWDAWQWSSTGAEPGVLTRVDLDQVDNPAAFDRACYPPPPVSVPVVPPPSFRTLRKGMAGLDVALLQQHLRGAGYTAVVVDGRFGPQTDTYVRAFQKKHGLAVDGIVGPQTWPVILSTPVA